MITSGFLLALILVAVLSYLLGSLNFAVIVSRFVARDDIRRHGSGSAGMTNMLRTYGKLPAAATAAGDFLKVVLAIVISRAITAYAGVEPAFDIGYVSGLFVLLGHLYPLYFGFRGGKGAIATLGIILATNPYVFLVIAVIFIPLVLIVRIVSIGSVLGSIAYPILTFVWNRFIVHQNPFYDTLFAALIMLFVLFAHRENIKRLLNGTENRFEKKK